MTLAQGAGLQDGGFSSLRDVQVARGRLALHHLDVPGITGDHIWTILSTASMGALRFVIGELMPVISLSNISP